jgi:uncharacterized protein YbjT (DUF2867 family)
MRVAVTGANGKTGRAVITALVAAGLSPVGIVRRAEAGEELAAAGVSARLADLEQIDTLVAAFSGIDAVYHVPPNMHPREDLLGERVIEAAQRAGVERFVLHSVLQPYVPAMPHHLRKALTEESLRASRLVWSVLQPASYAQNLLPFWADARDAGVYAVPYDISRPFTPVDLADVGAAAARVLTDPDCVFGTFELAGPHRLTSEDMAAQLGELAGHPVTAQRRNPASWGRSTGSSRAHASEADDLVAMFDWYDAHGLVGSPLTLRTLLGREPTDLATVLRRELAAAP